MDIFDKIMSFKILKRFQPIYEKHKEVLLYLFFGGLTVCVSIFSYFLFSEVMKIHELIANIASWILAVLFAYFTNSIWVFQSRPSTRKDFLKQISGFMGGRIITLLIEEIILFVFVTLLLYPGLLIKTLAQVLVIILNYIISKVFVFGKRDDIDVEEQRTIE